MTEQGLKFESVHYLDEPLSPAELKELLQRAGLSAHDALRKNEPSYRELVAGKNLSDQELIGLMAHHPELIQRPFVVCGAKAVLARPIENLNRLRFP